MQTVKDINLKGKTVLVRADYNVPVEDGKITDDYRITESLPTLRYLIDNKCKIIICSHLGRPNGRRDRAYSLRPVAKHLSGLLGDGVSFAYDCVGEEVQAAVKALKPGQLILLENLRFHPGEERNDSDFAAKLASLAEVFVQDGFAVVHRSHASTVAITKNLPSVAGLLLEKEVKTISEVMKQPKRPLAAIIGGAKIADKLDVLKRLIGLADFMAVGGAMANTFLQAKDIYIGKSLSDRDELPLAKDIIELAEQENKKRGFVFYLPQDGVVSKKIDKRTTTRIVDWSAHIISDIENYPKRPAPEDGKVSSDELIVDIGPFSGAFISGALQQVNTVIWNGAMGITETPALDGSIGPFAHGTELIVEAMLGQYGHRPYSLVGGGDTVGFVEARKLTGAFDHVSTGGGASLELLAGKKLPGLEALKKK